MSGASWSWADPVSVDNSTLPDGFHWEYRDVEESCKGTFPDRTGDRPTERMVSIRLVRRQRRAVGPWEPAA
jgi:hypothetical protein